MSDVRGRAPGSPGKCVPGGGNTRRDSAWGWAWCGPESTLRGAGGRSVGAAPDQWGRSPSSGGGAEGERAEFLAGQPWGLLLGSRIWRVRNRGVSWPDLPFSGILLENSTSRQHPSPLERAGAMAPASRILVPRRWSLLFFPFYRGKHKGTERPCARPS